MRIVRPNARIGFAIAISVMMLSPHALAQRAWDGSASTAWRADANWTPAGAPVSEDVVVDTISPNPTVLGAGDPVSIAALTVGLVGNGDLRIEGGGQLLTTANSTVGEDAGSIGRVEITGAGSQWVGAPHSFSLARDGYAEVTVLAGGLLSVGFLQAGNVPFSPETVDRGGPPVVQDQFADIRINGNGSRLVTSANFILNYGRVLVEAGASLEIGSVAFLGTNERMIELVLSGASQMTASDGIIIGRGPGPGSISNVRIGPSANVQTDTYVNVATNGSTAELDVSGSLDAGSQGLAVLVGGRLIGNGVVVGATDLAGTLAPAGALSTGAFVLQSGAQLEWNVGSIVDDSLNVDGNLTLDGTIDVIAGPAFDEGSFVLMVYSGSLTDNALAVGAMPEGFVGTIDTSTPGEVRLQVVIDLLFEDRFQSPI